MNILRLIAAFSLLSIAACASSTEDGAETSSAQTAAISSISATSHTCGAVHSFVKQHSAALVYRADGTYDRVVASEFGCDLGYRGSPDWMATSDSHACLVGYTCVASGD